MLVRPRARFTPIAIAYSASSASREHGSGLPQRRKQQQYAGGDLQCNHGRGDGRDQRIGQQTIVAERGTEPPPVGQLVPGGCAEQQRGAEGDDQGKGRVERGHGGLST